MKEESCNTTERGSTCLRDDRSRMRRWRIHGRSGRRRHRQHRSIRGDHGHGRHPNRDRHCLSTAQHGAHLPARQPRVPRRSSDRAGRRQRSWSDAAVAASTALDDNSVALAKAVGSIYGGELKTVPQPVAEAHRLLRRLHPGFRPVATRPLPRRPSRTSTATAPTSEPSSRARPKVSFPRPLWPSSRPSRRSPEGRDRQPDRR